MGNIAYRVEYDVIGWVLSAVGIVLAVAVAVYEARRSRALERQLKRLEQVISQRGSREADTIAIEVADAVEVADTVEGGVADVTRERLAEAIRGLPDREKLVIALHYYENLSLEEISEVLGLSPSTADALHTRAVLRLKSRLAGPSED